MGSAFEETARWVDVAEDAIRSEGQFHSGQDQSGVAAKQIRALLVAASASISFSMISWRASSEKNSLSPFFDDHAAVVLGGEDNRVDAIGRAVGQVFDGDLALGVGPNELQLLRCLRIWRMLFHKAMGQVDRQAA